MWTLWGLLIALPFAVLVTGCITLLRSWSGGTDLPQAPHQTLAAIRTSRTMQLVAATTVTAGAVLLIVIMHMLAN
jgi:hypothetical protein